MRIPTPSDVLIVGVSPVSLGFAVLLAKGGLNVLVIDKTVNRSTNKAEKLHLTAYSADILKQHGFKLDYGTTVSNFIEQGLSLLAHSLCSVIWQTEWIKSSNNHHQLLQEGKMQAHHSSFVFNLHDLQVSATSIEANFINVFALAWRVLNVQLQKIHPFILHSFGVEKNIISEFYEARAESGLWNQFVQKLSSPKVKDFNFIGSPVNLHLSQQRVLQAGELLPNFSFFDEKLKTEKSLHQWCSFQYFSLIIIGSINSHYLFNIAKWIQLNFNVKLFYLPYSERNESVFTKLNMSPSEKKTLIVRPDKYISLINDTVETDIIDNYLRNVLMMTANAEK